MTNRSHNTLTSTKLCTMDCASLSQSCRTFQQQPWRPLTRQVHCSRPFHPQSQPTRSLQRCQAALALPMPALAQHSGSAPGQRPLPETAVRENNISPAVSLRRSPSGKLLNTADAISQVHSPEELLDKLRQHEDNLVVLMCKAISCRPCKMFGRKYERIAAEHLAEGAVFLEILGDETSETRALMMSMQIKVTPTFCFYRSMNRVRTVTGVNEGNLRNAVKEEMEQIGSGHIPTAR